MSNLSNRSISIYIDQTAASVALQQLQRRADQLTQSIAAGQAAGRNMSNEIRRLADTQTSIRAVQDQLDRGLKPTLTQQKNLVTQLRNELGRMSESDPRFAERLRNYQAQNAELQRMRANIEGVNNSQGSLLTRAGAFAAGFLANMATQAVSFVTSAVSSLFSMNAAFEKSVQNLSAITGATGKDLDYLKNQAIELSKTGKQSATDYVEAFKLIASAKPELLGAREDLVNVTKAAKMLADSAGLELPDAATRLTDALNQFGAPAADAGKYVDALAAASKYGAAEVPEVTEALLKFGAQAKSSNIDIYESSGAIELLAEKGIKGAEAGTQLRNVFLALNAVGALPKSAIDALAQAGVNTDILKNKSLSLEDRLKELSKIQNNSTALVQVFGKENFNAAQILLQSLPRYSELTAQIKEQGVAAKQAAVNTDNLSDQWERFKNVLSARFLTGDNSFLKGLVKSMADLVEPIKTATQEFDEMTGKVVQLHTEILPLANRYDELKTKTKLSTAEQAEMKTIIGQITAAIPGAVTQFDQYGNAIAISTDRVRDFVKVESDRLKVVNQSAIAENTSKLKDVNEELAKQKTLIDAIAKTGSFTVSTHDYSQFGAPNVNRQATQEEIAAAQDKYKQLLDFATGYNAELKRLSGDTLKEQVNAVQSKAAVLKQLEDMLTKLKEGTKEYAAIQEEINKIKGIANAAPAAPEDSGNTKAEEKAQSERDKLLQKLKEFQFELQQVGKQSDESEIERIKHKYAELTAGVGKALADQIQLEKDKNAAIAFLIDEEIKKRSEASKTEFKTNTAKEYDQALADSANYFAGLKKEQADSFVNGEIDQQQYQANLTAIDVAAKQAQLQTAQDYSTNVEKAAADVTKFKKEELDKEVADLIAANAKKLANEKLLQQLNTDAALARAQHAVNNTAPGTNARLTADKALLDAQEKQALEAVDKREKEAQQAGIKYDQEFNELRAVIDDEYQAKRKQKEIDYYTGLADFALNYFSQAIGVIQQFNANKDRLDQKALDNELKANEKKKAGLDKQLKQRTISQQQYNIEVAKLDVDADKKKEDLERKQFNRKKRQDTIQALIDISKAVTTDIANYGAPIPPNFLSMAAVGFDALIGGAKVAAIQAQQFATGGQVKQVQNGLVTAAPNIPTQANGDNVLATIKTGEVVLNEEQQRRAGGAAFFRSIGVPGFATGGQIKPVYQSRSYQAINFAAATQSITAAKAFATGGKVTSSTPTDPALLDMLQQTNETLQQSKAANEQLLQANAALINTVAGLTDRLNKGINANVQLQKIKDAEAQQARIMESAIFQ